MSKRSGKRQKKAASVAHGSKRRQFTEFLRKILDALEREDGFQEAEELIAELKGSTGGYLPALLRQVEETGGEERLNLLNIVSHLEDPQAVPYLERLIFESPVDVAAKRRAAEILEQLGNPLEVGMAESLDNAATILERIPDLKPEAFHGSHPLFVKFVQLPPVLRQVTLIELASSAPAVALNFVELIRSREPRPHPETIEALVLLEDLRAVEILEEYLEGATDKETAREVRRALYRLNSRGIRVEEKSTKTRPEGHGIFRPVTTPPQGLMSVIDGSGTRIVWLAKPLAGGGRLLFQAIISDERGLLDFSSVEVSLRSFRSYVDEITGRGKELPVSEVPAAYAAYLMEEAYQLSQDREDEIPQDYPIHQRQIADLVGEEKPSLAEKLEGVQASGPDEISTEEMKELLQRPEFASWVLAEDDFSPFAEELNSLVESQLVVSQGARQDQVDEICRKATAALFNRDRLERLARRLEETAYVLLMTGRNEVARSAIGAATSLRKHDGDPADHPFLEGMVRRSVMGLLSSKIPADEKEEASVSPEGEQDQQKEPSLIVTPDEVRREAAERMAQRPTGPGDSPSIITPG